MQPEMIVRDFCEAFSRQNLQEILDFFSDDAVYHNIPIAPAEGKPAIEATLKQFVDPNATAEVELLGRAAKKAAQSRYRLPVGSLGELLAQLPESLSLTHEGRVAKSHLVSLGGRDLVRDLAVPIGPDEQVSVIDALAGG